MTAVSTARVQKRTTVAVGSSATFDLASAGTAGVFPEDTAFRVRVDHHSSIRVDITTWHGAVYSDPYMEHLMDPGVPDPTNDTRQPPSARIHRHAARLVTAIADTEAIADRHNYDNSDTMADLFDVGYYLHVGAGPVEAYARQAIELERDPGFRALYASALAVVPLLGDRCVASVCGESGLMGATKHECERMVRIAARAAGRPVAYDRRRHGWFPVEASDVG